MTFSSKAQTLRGLHGKLKHAVVPDLFIFNVADWKADPSVILSQVRVAFPGREALVVRSSCALEDSASSSMAGHYTSILNVRRPDQLEMAICQVIASYGEAKDEDEVFVQRQVENVALSGVAFTYDPNFAAPYYVVNYDDQTQHTDSVTSGTSNRLKTFVCFRDLSRVSLPRTLNRLFDLLTELEEKFDSKFLDVEFAIDREQNLFLLQVRPISWRDREIVSQESIAPHLNHLHDHLLVVNNKHPFLLGQKTIFGVMPDWNPAEIIGVRPRPLALSLYKELITDNIWAYQRDNYGYRNLRSFPLMHSFCGRPYIDVRVDFNSFIPADIPEELAEKLVSYYLKILEMNPGLHDKVEFEIVFSCYTFDLQERLKVLALHGFSQAEISLLEQSLKDLTNNIVDPVSGLWKKDAAKIEILIQRRNAILESSLPKIEKLYWLIEDCKRYGTLPFAGLARAAFIAVQILKSLVEQKVLTSDDFDAFFSSISSVSSQMFRDFRSKSKEDFLAVYGHLRPGTYDILSKRYDAEPDLYFDWSKDDPKHSQGREFSLSLQQLNVIESILKKQDMRFTSLSLFDFLKSAIEGREYSKFVFSKNISDSLEIINQMAQDLDLSETDASFLNIVDLMAATSTSKDLGLVFRESIRNGKSRYAVTEQIHLPSLIISPSDIYAHHVDQNEPNFITNLKACGPTVCLNGAGLSFENRIVFIPSADPGFDWLFSKNIAGFVTMYGGINSHMAIRANELGIPAVVGAGETLYNTWAKANILEIDCSNKQVQIFK